MSSGKEDPAVWSMDTVEVSNYFSHFYTLCPSGALPKASGKKFFTRLNVPTTSLSLLWNLSDVDRDGFLNTAEFCVAMHLIKQHLAGIPLPKTLPKPLKLYAKQEIKLPVAQDSQKDHCLEVFERCKEHIHEGILEGKIAKFLLTKSKLSSSQLFHIWNLADIDKDGGLTLEEFRLAIRLISLAKQGLILPTSVKARDVLPCSFFEAEEGITDKDQGQTSFTHRSLPLSPSWANFEDSNLGDTEFSTKLPSHLSPIEEEEAIFVTVNDQLDSSAPDVATESAFEEQAVSEDDKSIEEKDKININDDDPFQKDSFVDIKEDLSNTVNSSVNDTQPLDDPISSKRKRSIDEAFGFCDQNSAAVGEVENPFRKDSFVGLKEEELSEDENPFRRDSFVLQQEEAELSASEVVRSSKPGSSLHALKEEHDPFLKSDPFNSTVTVTKSVVNTDTSFDLNSLPEEEPRSKFQLITSHSELSATHSVDYYQSEGVVPFEYDPFEEEPFFSDHTAANLQSSGDSTSAVDSATTPDTPLSVLDSVLQVPGPSEESVDSDTHWSKFDSFDHSFDPRFDSVALKSELSDSQFYTFDNHLELPANQSLDAFDLSNPFDSKSPPVDSLFDSKPLVDSELHSDHCFDSELRVSSAVNNSVKEMAADTSTIPDLDNADFTLDDLTSIIAEMELVTESLNEEPTPASPPAVAEKPKKASPSASPEKPKKVSPPVAPKKYERKKPVNSNEQSAKKPQSFLNEVNIEKSKEQAQQIELDIAGDVFSELEAQLQLELMEDADRVPEEVQQVLKELNAPYSMGLENMESELGIKSEDSQVDVGDLISELHGMGEKAADNFSETAQENGDQDVREDGLTDAYTGSSMDDLLSELKGMEDKDQTGDVTMPTLNMAASEEPVVEDPLADFDLNLDDELASITNTISNFTGNPPAANQNEEVNFDTTEASYEDALIEHRWKKMEKEQNRRDQEASEVQQLNQESDMALKSLEEEMQSLLMTNQSSNNNTGESVVLRVAKTSTGKELKSVRRRSSLAEMWEEAVAQRIKQGAMERQSSGTNINVIKMEREDALRREAELQKERQLKQQALS